MIKFESVSKSYDGNMVLNDLSFHVERGELAFLTGPSGAGKTTILKLIYHALAPEAGNIYINGQNTCFIKQSDIPWLRRSIGIVFQDFRLLLTKTVFENVALALRIRGLDEREIKARVMETLKMVGLRHKSDNFPQALSGGEQQRVVIARAIVSEPMLILADEPTGNLDPETAAGIMNSFKEINARGATILIATHNRDLYHNSGRKVFRIASGTAAGIVVRQEES
ncbi:MAG: cell division ATP-binding protein FtsE [Actinomycetota bacterium]|nr:cell division ATP-binding protein FtsE [Actinomycetota bacterium]